MDKSSLENIFARVSPEPNSGCWLWTGALSVGYGQVRYGGRVQFVHRLMYEHYLGSIPPGLVIDHLCRVRACCNPAHLEAVTQRVNILRGESLCARNNRKSHCHRGHPFTPENTCIRLTGERECKACRRDYQALRRRTAA